MATSTKIAAEVNLDNLTKFFGYWDDSHQWLKNFINENEDEIKMGVEVGVAFGANMKTLLEGTKLEKLFGVDPYSGDTWDLSSHVNVKEEYGSFDSLYAHVEKLLKPFGTRSKLIRATSLEASKKFKNESLDFVFIDGDHLDVETDVKCWEPKIKSGGYIMGHDWNHANFMNITNFVNDYFGKENVTGIDGPVHIWYVQKGSYN